MAEVERRFARGAMYAFAQGGFHATTTSDIGDATGVSQPRISQVFDGKLHAFHTALDLAMELLVDELRAMPGSKFSLAEFVKSVEAVRYDRPEAVSVVVHALTPGMGDHALVRIAHATLQQLATVLVDEMHATPQQARAALAELVTTELVAAAGGGGHQPETRL